MARGGRGHAAVPGVVAPGGAGAAVAGARGGGRVRATGGTGSPVGPWGEGVVDMGGWWCAWRRLGGLERRWRELGVVVAYGRRGEPEAWWGLWGEGVVDMGRRWRAWWLLGEVQRRERGPGGSWWRLGEPERLEWVVEAPWRFGERERQGWVRRAGGGAEAQPFAGPPLVARVAPVRRCQRVLGGLARRRMVLGGGGESPALH